MRTGLAVHGRVAACVEGPLFCGAGGRGSADGSGSQGGLCRLVARFGNLLIIDHGESYLSLYGYNETPYQQVGDVIRGGEHVTAIGNSGRAPGFRFIL